MQSPSNASEYAITLQAFTSFMYAIALCAGLKAFEVDQVNKIISDQTCTYIQSVFTECGLIICVTPGMHTIYLGESQEVLK